MIIMKALAITSKGIEDITALEIKELIKVEGSVKESVVVFEPKKILDLCTLCYKGQSVSRVLFLLESFEFKDKKDLLKKFGSKKIDYGEWLDKSSKFMVECRRVGKHKFSSQDVEKEIGELMPLENKVSLDKPDVVFYAYIFENSFYFGVDFAGFDLSKRQYKVFNHPNDIKGTIAYALVRLSGFNKDVLLDPFCKTGVIPIEAALFASGFPVNYFNKERFRFLKLKPFLKTDFKKFFEKKVRKSGKIFGYEGVPFHIVSAKKNAKIAGVDVEFSNAGVEWIDTHFKKGEVNRIVCYPPVISDKWNKKEILKLYQELFYQANYCLAKEGRIVVVSNDVGLLKEKAERYKFKVFSERKIWLGKLEIGVAVFGRG
jgi:23S rRNA G2445 N2-methylase RlmL